MTVISAQHVRTAPHGSPKSKPASSNTLLSAWSSLLIYNKSFDSQKIKKQNIHPAVNMPVTHVVMFKFKDDVPPKEIRSVCGSLMRGSRVASFLKTYW
jgi:hypothetical protein